MAVCEAYRIPHSHFLGGPLEWTQLDRDKAIWYQAYKAECCPGCGIHPDEWDPSKGGSRTAYVAKDMRCPGCAQVEQMREAFESQKTKPRGVHILLRRPEKAPQEGRSGGDNPGAGDRQGAAPKGR